MEIAKECGIQTLSPLDTESNTKMRFVEFETERLLFRKFKEDDFSTVFSWHRDIENIGYRRDGVKNEEETRKYFDWIIAEANANVCKNFWFAVVRKNDEKLLGEGILLDVPEKPEMGWLMDKRYWGQGYGTDVGAALLKFGFDVLNLRRIIAACHADNHASYKLMEKIGMKREAHFVKEKLYGTDWCDRFQYAILREEWERMILCKH